MLALAPLTRMRAAKPSLAPRPLNAEYYAQRATPGGLLIAEASPVMATGFGSPGVPGIYTEAQIAGWREVVDAVHAKGGVIFLQLWHVGRVSHSSFQPGGVLPVAPSAVAIADLKTGTADGKAVPYETPRALETSEIPGVIDAYRQAAKNALESRLRRRRDPRRQRLPDRAVPAVAHQSAHRSIWRLHREPHALPDGSDARPWSRSGARTASACGCRPMASPMVSGEPDPMPLYTHVVEQLNPLGLAYLHFIEPRSSGAGRAEVNHQNVPSAMVLFRPIWKGVLITAGGFTGETADAAIRDGHADMIAFGRIFISNPDLPRRLQRGFPLTPYNRATFYGGDVAGYTDYPEHDELEKA